MEYTLKDRVFLRKQSEIDNPSFKNDSTLSSREYNPNISGLEFRLRVKRFTDPETGAVILPSLSYMMPQVYNGRVLGVYTPSEHEIAADISLSTAEYGDTLKHELYHAQGHGEWMTRFLNNDSPADYT